MAWLDRTVLLTLAKAGEKSEHYPQCNEDRRNNFHDWQYMKLFNTLRLSFSPSLIS